jgi:hypothetical protein
VLVLGRVHVVAERIRHLPETGLVRALRARTRWLLSSFCTFGHPPIPRLRCDA